MIKKLLLFFLCTLVHSVSANELRKSDIDEDQLRQLTLSLMVSNRDYGKNYRKLYLNGAYLELWDLRKKVVYFSFPQGKSAAEISKEFLKNPTKRVNAKLKDNKLEVDGLFLLRTSEKYNLISTNADNFLVNPDKKLNVNFDKYEFITTPLNLAQNLRNDFIMTGSLRVRSVPEGIERPKFMNHGALVTKKGEKFLTDFVEQIIHGTSSNEEKIQAISDFVTEQITYDEKDFYFGREFLQRATETLLAKTADCSNKSILMASMLEQIGAEYLMVYSDNHIFIAVPRGNFPASNGYTFSFDDKKWVVVETTVPKFKIGITKLTKENLVKDIKYIQIPNEKNILYRYSDRKLIMFN